MNRHPHVFGDATAETSADVKRNWEALKVEERKKRQGSVANSAEDKGSRDSGIDSLGGFVLDAVVARSSQAQFQGRADGL